MILYLCFILQAQAEPETDEVYAQITLLPELDVSKFDGLVFYKIRFCIFFLFLILVKLLCLVISKANPSAQMPLFKNLKSAQYIHFARH